MARYSSKDVAFLLVDGFSILGGVTELTDLVTAQTEETTVLGDRWVTHGSLDIRSWEMTQNGFYDQATGAVHDALSGSEGLERVVCMAYRGNLVGSAFTGAGGAFAANFQRVAERAAFMKANATYRASGTVEQGAILQPLGPITDSPDTGAVHDNSASTAEGGAIYLQIVALDLDGADDLLVVVEHSADNTTFTTLGTFSLATLAPAAERKAVSGTINRYTRVHWAFEGSGTAPAATIMVGLARA